MQPGKASRPFWNKKTEFEKRAKIMQIFDTTLRDGLLSKKVQLNLKQKIKIAQILDKAGIDVIEIAHILKKDNADEIEIGKAINPGKICVLVDTKPDNLQRALDFMQATHANIVHVYSMANIKEHEVDLRKKEIDDAVKLFKDLGETVRWTGFDGNRAEHKIFKPQMLQAAASGAKIISIPDSFGVNNPEEFETILTRIFSDWADKGPKFSVHCHDDLGFAVENSVRAVRLGVYQVEMTLCGVGARKGNCNLSQFLKQTSLADRYNFELIQQAEEILLNAIVD
jgi:2-isopropylmalate synthase